ncbi:MAG: phage holin family protein [Jatrophihabitans sp.]|uniref:phage holin family protein n=1 Tax=Jatrophihabitans sp. TaxID=1932789 RepID=UPI003F7EC058
MSAPTSRPTPQYQPQPASPAPSYTAPTPAAEPIEEVSVGQLVSNISKDMSTLMRQELELAKVEIKTEVTKAAKGAGMLGGAGYAGHLTVVFLSVAAGFGLANLMDSGWAFLLVTLFWAIVGAVLFVTGRKTLKTVDPKPERTVETVQQIPPALKPNP